MQNIEDYLERTAIFLNSPTTTWTIPIESSRACKVVQSIFSIRNVLITNVRSQGISSKVDLRQPRLFSEAEGFFVVFNKIEH